MNTLLQLMNPSRAMRPARCSEFPDHQRPDMSQSAPEPLDELISIYSFRLIELIERAVRWLQARLYR